MRQRTFWFVQPEALLLITFASTPFLHNCQLKSFTAPWFVGVIPPLLFHSFKEILVPQRKNYFKQKLHIVRPKLIQLQHQKKGRNLCWTRTLMYTWMSFLTSGLEKPNISEPDLYTNSPLLSVEVSETCCIFLILLYILFQQADGEDPLNYSNTQEYHQRKRLALVTLEIF